MSDMQGTSLEEGAERIRGYAKTLPDKPGVYRMLGSRDEPLYVGKALSLKKRVISYASVHRLPVRLQRMVAQTLKMEFVHTQTEAEALLLESNLIKKLKPRYNILLRDDKSFPHILITGDHDYPLVTKHRGAKRRKGQYFGPFAGAGDVNKTITTLQRIFQLRNCSDNVFANRSRPCLQYHIKRCTAPCVEKVSKEEYADQVGQATAFLEGRSDELKGQLSEDMKAASARQDYESAALYRDRIQALSAIQSHQDINIEGVGNADILALAQLEGRTCVQVFFFRGGRNYGNRSFFPRHDPDRDIKEIFSAFIAQFYENKPVPKQVIISHSIEQKALLEEAMSSKVDFKVKINKPARGRLKRAVDFALKNAQSSLKRHLAQEASEAKHLQAVAELFDMEEVPERIEVYDNSHISGTNMVGAMIVSGPDGFQKNAYRKFNIKEAGASDDYGMMKEVLERRFKRALKENPSMSGPDWPDLLLIDGGKGQLSTAQAVLEEYGIVDSLTLVAIAKGEERNAGRETFFQVGKKSFKLPVNEPVLFYLQRLRDEAHRFAVGSHQKRRQSSIKRSSLDDIPGIGPAKKKELLAYFGSAKGVERASVQDLEKIRGVSKKIAQKIYDHFH